ncbi:MAG: hypothetical protein IPL74_15320 [Bacteroidetes bacterium]|nr:hypothetical protein [Bacteroidota bacterium]
MVFVEQRRIIHGPVKKTGNYNCSKCHPIVSHRQNKENYRPQQIKLFFDCHTPQNSQYR